MSSSSFSSPALTAVTPRTSSSGSTAQATADDDRVCIVPLADGDLITLGVRLTSPPWWFNDSRLDVGRSWGGSGQGLVRWLTSFGARFRAMSLVAERTVAA